MHIVLFGFILRIVVSYLFLGARNHDTIGWWIIGETVLKGEGIYPYPAHEYHAFFPLFLYINSLAVFLQNFHIPYMFINKAIVSVFDAGIIYLVYILSGKNRKKAWMYAINPISLFITGIHGQFDSIPLFFLLFSIFLFRKKKVLLSGLFASVGIGFKTWPIMFLLPLIKRVKKAWFIPVLFLTALISVVIYVLLYKSDILAIFFVTLFYRGQMGSWGIGYIISLFTQNKIALQIFSNLFLLSFLVFSLRLRSKDVVTDTLDQLIFFFIFSPTFGIQWLAWIVPFLIIKQPKHYLAFIAMTSFFMFIPNLFWLSENLGGKLMPYLTAFSLLSWFMLVVVGWGRLKNHLNNSVIGSS